MSATIRLTQSGACASCGIYPGVRCSSAVCRSGVTLRRPVGDSGPNGCFMSAHQDLASLDDEDQYLRLWYGPRIRERARA